MSYTSHSSKQLNYKQEAEMEIINLLDFGKATQLCPFWPRRIIPFG